MGRELRRRLLLLLLPLLLWESCLSHDGRIFGARDQRRDDMLLLRKPSGLTAGPREGIEVSDLLAPPEATSSDHLTIRLKHVIDTG
jgi:hypothetical protein